MKLRWEDRVRVLQAVFCAGLIGLDVALCGTRAAVPAIAAILSWQLTLTGRETRHKWPPVLALVLGLGTNVVWLIFFHRIVVSPIGCCMIGLETHQFFDRWNAKE